MGVTLIGGWNKFGMILQRLSATLFPLAKVKLDEEGQMILEKLQSHIDAQDLDWAELSPITVARKGNSQIYVETGDLRSAFTVKKINNGPRGSSLFIGVENKIHAPSGLPMNELMIYMEYGTGTNPARPLIRPTWEEVKPLIQDNMQRILEELVKG